MEDNDGLMFSGTVGGNYNLPPGNECDYNQAACFYSDEEEDEDEELLEYGDENPEDEDLLDEQDEQHQDNNDLHNYKGIYFGEDPGRKFQCPITGAHFEYSDMCKRLKSIKEAYEKYELQQQEQVHQKLMIKQQLISSEQLQQQIANKTNDDSKSANRQNIMQIYQQTMPQNQGKPIDQTSEGQKQVKLNNFTDSQQPPIRNQEIQNSQKNPYSYNQPKAATNNIIVVADEASLMDVSENLGGSSIDPASKRISQNTNKVPSVNQQKSSKNQTEKNSKSGTLGGKGQGGINEIVINKDQYLQYLKEQLLKSATQLQQHSSGKPSSSSRTTRNENNKFSSKTIDVRSSGYNPQLQQAENSSSTIAINHSSRNKSGLTNTSTNFNKKNLQQSNTSSVSATKRSALISSVFAHNTNSSQSQSKNISKIQKANPTSVGMKKPSNERKPYESFLTKNLKSGAGMSSKTINSGIGQSNALGQDQKTLSNFRQNVIDQHPGNNTQKTFGDISDVRPRLSQSTKNPFNNASGSISSSMGNNPGATKYSNLNALAKQLAKKAVGGLPKKSRNSGSGTGVNTLMPAGPLATQSSFKKSTSNLKKGNSGMSSGGVSGTETSNKTLKSYSRLIESHTYAQSNQSNRPQSSTKKQAKSISKERKDTIRGKQSYSNYAQGLLAGAGATTSYKSIYGNSLKNSKLSREYLQSALEMRSKASPTITKTKSTRATAGGLGGASSSSSRNQKLKPSLTGQPARGDYIHKSSAGMEFLRSGQGIGGGANIHPVSSSQSHRNKTSAGAGIFQTSNSVSGGAMLGGHNSVGGQIKQINQVSTVGASSGVTQLAVPVINVGEKKNRYL